MKKIILTSFSLLSAALITFLLTMPVLAHGDEPRIELSAVRVTPGSVLDIRGVDFEVEEVVVLSLVGPHAELPLGTITAGVEGTFLLTITLPVDLVEGDYLIRGTTDDHAVDSPTFTIWGTAPAEGGGQGERDEDDGLLAPMPTFAPATPASASLGVPASPATANSITPVLWIAAGLALVLLLGLVILFLKKS